MSEDLQITTSNGRVYNSLRAYHIALGHAVRQALLNFVDEIEQFAQDRVQEFYGEYNPKNYERTYQLLNKMQVGQLIKTKVIGNWEGKGVIEIEPFDFTELEARFNEYGKFNTYMSFDGIDSTADMEDILASGIKGHDGFEIRKEIQQFINQNLDDRIEKAINKML